MTVFPLLVHFDYDTNGNRTKKVTSYPDTGRVDEQVYSYYENTNHLKHDGDYTYEYDDCGNLIRRYNDFVEYRYNWNAENLLSSVDLRQYRFGWNEAWEEHLSEEELDQFLCIFKAKYDESGRRYWKWAKQQDGSVKETRYAYTNLGLLYEQTSSENGITEKSYIYAEGRKIAELQGSLDEAEVTENTVTGFASNIISYVVSDQLGSTRLLVNKEGTILWYAEYEAFGNTSYEEQLSSSASTDQTFTSYTRDKETGLHYAMARYYQAELGRFITEDPAKDGRNWYVYCANNPLKYVDPSGLAYFNGEEWVSSLSPEENTSGKSKDSGNSSSSSTTGGTGGPKIPFLDNETGLDSGPDTLGTENFTEKEDNSLEYIESLLKYVEYIRNDIASSFKTAFNFDCGKDSMDRAFSEWDEGDKIESAGWVFFSALEAGMDIALAAVATEYAAGKISAFIAARAAPPLAGAAGSVTTSNSSQILNMTTRQLQAKFKHAADFGVTGNWNSSAASRFSSAINQHINSPGVRAIQGTYRGDAVIHYLNPNTGLNVISSPTGQFISGWQLNPAQLTNVLSRGGL